MVLWHCVFHEWSYYIDTYKITLKLRDFLLKAHCNFCSNLTTVKSTLFSKMKCELFKDILLKLTANWHQSHSQTLPGIWTHCRSQVSTPGGHSSGGSHNSPSSSETSRLYNIHKHIWFNDSPSDKIGTEMSPRCITKQDPLGQHHSLKCCTFSGPFVFNIRPLVHNAQLRTSFQL